MPRQHHDFSHHAESGIVKSICISLPAAPFILMRTCSFCLARANRISLFLVGVCDFFGGSFSEYSSVSPAYDRNALIVNILHFVATKDWMPYGLVQESQVLYLTTGAGQA